MDNNKVDPADKMKIKYLKRDETRFSIIKKFRKIAGKFIVENYNSDKDTIHRKIANDIVYNEKSHIVAVFKDFLIYDDTSEFLKRFYNINETKFRLPKYLEYYELNSKIFPNYINLPESKYLYRNIKRKQRMIDNIQRFENDKKKKKDNDETMIFNTQIIDYILNQTSIYDSQTNLTLNNSFSKHFSNKNLLSPNKNANVNNKLANNNQKQEKIKEKKINKNTNNTNAITNSNNNKNNNIVNENFIRETKSTIKKDKENNPNNANKALDIISTFEKLNSNAKNRLIDSKSNEKKDLNNINNNEEKSFFSVEYLIEVIDQAEKIVEKNPQTHRDLNKFSDNKHDESIDLQKVKIHSDRGSTSSKLNKDNLDNLDNFDNKNNKKFNEKLKEINKNDDRKTNKIKKSVDKKNNKFLMFYASAKNEIDKYKIKMHNLANNSRNSKSRKNSKNANSNNNTNLLNDILQLENRKKQGYGNDSNNLKSNNNNYFIQTQKNSKKNSFSKNKNLPIENASTFNTADPGNSNVTAKDKKYLTRNEIILNNLLSKDNLIKEAKKDQNLKSNNTNSNKPVMKSYNFKNKNDNSNEKIKNNNILVDYTNNDTNFNLKFENLTTNKSQNKFVEKDYSGLKIQNMESKSSPDEKNLDYYSKGKSNIKSSQVNFEINIDKNILSNSQNKNYDIINDLKNNNPDDNSDINKRRLSRNILNYNISCTNPSDDKNRVNSTISRFKDNSAGKNVFNLPLTSETNRILQSNMTHTANGDKSQEKVIKNQAATQREKESALLIHKLNSHNHIYNKHSEKLGNFNTNVFNNRGGNSNFLQSSQQFFNKTNIDLSVKPKINTHRILHNNNYIDIHKENLNSNPNSNNYIINDKNFNTKKPNANSQKMIFSKKIFKINDNNNNDTLKKPNFNNIYNNSQTNNMEMTTNCQNVLSYQNIISSENNLGDKFNIIGNSQLDLPNNNLSKNQNLKENKETFGNANSSNKNKNVKIIVKEASMLSKEDIKINSYRSKEKHNFLKSNSNQMNNFNINKTNTAREYSRQANSGISFLKGENISVLNSNLIPTNRSIFSPINPESKFIANISPRQSTPVKDLNLANKNSVIKDKEVFTSNLINKNNTNFIINPNNFLQKKSSKNQIRDFNPEANVEFINTNKIDKKGDFIYNILSNGVKVQEAEFKILSARLSRKASGVSSSISRVRDQNGKSTENIVKNSLKDPKLSNFNSNTKSKVNTNTNSNINLNINSFSNVNLMFNSSIASAKFNLSNKGKSNNTNFNTNANGNINTNLNNAKGNFINKNINHNGKNIEIGVSVDNFSNKNNLTSKVNLNPSSKIKGIQIKNFNQILLNNLTTKACCSNSDRTVKSIKKV